jgi:hypothetical protein
VVAAGLATATFADRQDGRPSMMILLGVIAIASVYYQMVLRPRGWRVHLPGEKGSPGTFVTPEPSGCEAAVPQK